MIDNYKFNSKIIKIRNVQNMLCCVFVIIICFACYYLDLYVKYGSNADIIDCIITNVTECTLLLDNNKIFIENNNINETKTLLVDSEHTKILTTNYWMYNKILTSPTCISLMFVLAILVLFVIFCLFERYNVILPEEYEHRRNVMMNNLIIEPTQENIDELMTYQKYVIVIKPITV